MVGKRLNASPIWAVLLFAVIGMFMLACSPCWSWWPGLTGGGNTTGTVTWTFYITANGVQKNMANMSVKMGQYSTTTDSNGHFRLTGVTPGTHSITVSGGDLGWNKTVNVRAGSQLDLGRIELHGTLPPPGTTNTTTGTTYPATPEDVIRAYYAAINEGDYSKAKSYTTGNMANIGLDALRASFEPYVKNIQVVSVTHEEKFDMKTERTYYVKFQADYIKHYPAGSGNLQEYHALIETSAGWKITGTGTGP